MATVRRKLRPIPAPVLEVLRRLKRAGGSAYIVGGAVRDLLRKKPIKDFDLASPLTPEEVVRLFPRVAVTGIKYGTVTILHHNHKLEHTTYRREISYSDQRHPDQVFFSKHLEEDLARRDFTVNALAYDPLRGELIDLFGGLKDLKSKTLNTVGKPLERFNEDALRVIRAGRFCGQLSFRPGRGLLKAMSLFAAATERLSPERIRDELIKILNTPRPSLALELLRKAGILHRLLPELCAGRGLYQGGPHRFDIYRHSLAACDASRGGALLRLAALLHDVGKVVTRKKKAKSGFCFYGHDLVGQRLVRRRLQHLRFAKREIEYVNTLVRQHMFNYSPLWSDGAIRRLLVKMAPHPIDDLLDLRRADVTGLDGRSRPCPQLRQLKGRIRRLLKRDQALAISDLAVDGHEVMAALGIGPGKAVGEVLRHLLEQVLENQALNRKEVLLGMARKKFGHLLPAKP